MSVGARWQWVAVGGRGEAGKGPATTQTASGYRVRPAGGGPRSTSAGHGPPPHLKTPTCQVRATSDLRDIHCVWGEVKGQGPELSLTFMYKGRRQNSLAAVPIFSSQLQPTYIEKAIYGC